jgi:hypothetical protein
MAKPVTALKDILRRSESLLEKLKKTVPTMAHAKSAALLRQIINGKKATIKTYKSILKEAQKCPAVKKKTKAKKKRPATAKGKKGTAKKGAARTRSKKGSAK